MVGTASPPVVVSRPEPPALQQVPLWATVALLVSGAVLVLVETANLLFFLGLLFAVVGVYLGLARSGRSAGT